MIKVKVKEVKNIPNKNQIPMERIKLTRKELYDIVWKEPLSSLAKKYKISDNGLRKICKRMNIPLPPNGYWQKIRYGKQVKIEKLPEKYSGQNEIILDEKGSGFENADSPIIKQRRLVEEIEKNKKLPLTVQERLTDPDRLVINSKQYFEAVKHIKGWENYPKRVDVLNIDVTYENLPRALRIIDTVIKLLIARNHEVKIKYDKTYAVIEGEEIEFRIREKKRATIIKDKWGSTQYEHTGELAFIIGDPWRIKEVKDDSVELLETKLSIVLAKFELEGLRWKEIHEETDRQRKIQEERERIEREIKEKKENESRDFKKLFSQATRFHQANILREYVKTVEENSIKNGNISDELRNWIIWAKQKIEWYDPLINREDPLLDEGYKTNIFRDFLKEWQ
jgi:hypothetical protein